MGSRIKGAKLEIIESAGHAPHITEPELFNKILQEFLHLGFNFIIKP